MGRIVVGVDETPQAADALRWATDEAARRGWQVTAVLAFDLLSQHHPDPSAPFDPHYGRTAAQEALDAFVDRSLAPDRAADVERLVVLDVPAHALRDAAADADLLVLGCRDLHGISRLIDGSVSASIRRHPPCPTVIVHGDGRIEPVDAADPIGRPGPSRADDPASKAHLRLRPNRKRRTGVSGPPGPHLQG